MAQNRNFDIFQFESRQRDPIVNTFKSEISFDLPEQKLMIENLRYNEIALFQRLLYFPDSHHAFFVSFFRQILILNVFAMSLGAKFQSISFGKPS